MLSVVIAGLGLLSQQHDAPTEKTDVAVSATSSVQPSASSDENDSAVDQAFAHHARDVQVEGQGVVVKILRDDNEGSRHQKFLLRMQSGLTVLVAHNIDLAPRVAELRAGDRVEFNGEYEWSEKGGVVHWTHLDPAGRHVGGWLKHDGHTYQ